MPNVPINRDDENSFRTDDGKTADAPSFYDSLPSGPTAIHGSDVLSSALEDIPSTFGPYALLEQIGRGGMGSVFRARHSETGQIFALKVLRRGIFASQSDIQRFEKESRIHAQIQSPFVARHVEFNEHQRTHFIVSEYVEGLDLQRLCSRIAQLEPKCALLIIRDVLKALAAIHELGIVHRDVKPGNVMIVGHRRINADRFCIEDFQQSKLMDFGIARQIDQTESLAMTHTEMTLGTPLYMAPEQREESRSVTPAADVYSVGATLYHLLAGFPPFQSKDNRILAEMHRQQRPGKLKRIDGSIGDAINNVVLKALEKQPSMRYADGGKMLPDIEQLLAGQPTSLRAWPAIPQAEPNAVKVHTFTWAMNVSPTVLWPFVADTDRFNRAMNLPAPEYSFADVDGESTLQAVARFNGMSVRWREKPFQWVVGRELSVLREFESGPFEWVTSTILLEPLHSDQTRLIHEFKVKPRGWLGRLITFFQFGFVIRKQIDRVYRRIESLASQTNNPFACDASFSPPQALNRNQLDYLDKIGAKMSRSIDNPALLDRLVDFLKFSGDQSVARMRPIELAKKFGCEPDSLIAVCLCGADGGLLRLMWDIICPVCRIATTTTDSLKNIAGHARCEFCKLDFKTDFASSVELIFRVHPEIRNIDTRTYCIGGPVHSPHVLAQNLLPAGQQVEFGVALLDGLYQIRSPQLDEPTRLETDPNCVDQRLNVEFPNSVRELLPIAGHWVSVQLHNRSEVELTTRFERLARHHDAVTAAQASAHPLFRKYFPDEVLSVEDLTTVQSLLVVCFRIIEFDALADEVGEVAANRIVQQLIDRLFESADDVQLVNCTFDRFTLAVEKSGSAIAICDRILQYAPIAGIAFALLISSGPLQSTDSITGRHYYGKTIRDCEALLNHSRPDQVIVLNSICQHSKFREWVGKRFGRSHSEAADLAVVAVNEYEFFSRPR